MRPTSLLQLRAACRRRPGARDLPRHGRRRHPHPRRVGESRTRQSRQPIPFPVNQLAERNHGLAPAAWPEPSTREVTHEIPRPPVAQAAPQTVLPPRHRPRAHLSRAAHLLRQARSRPHRRVPTARGSPPRRAHARETSRRGPPRIRTRRLPPRQGPRRHRRSETPRRGTLPRAHGPILNPRHLAQGTPNARRRRRQRLHDRRSAPRTSQIAGPSRRQRPRAGQRKSRSAKLTRPVTTPTARTDARIDADWEKEKARRAEREREYWAKKNDPFSTFGN